MARYRAELVADGRDAGYRLADRSLHVAARTAGGAGIDVLAETAGDGSELVVVYARRGSELVELGRLQRLRPSDPFVWLSELGVVVLERPARE